jgi:hypothetical protein
MFKAALKLIVFILLVAGVFSLILPNKAAADSNCPSNGLPPTSWGINTGSETHGFASVTVHTTDGATNQELNNINFTVHSQLPRSDTGYSYGSTPPGTTVNDRIFQWGTNGPGSAGRWNSYRFSTGEANYVGSQIKQIGPEFRCAGWTELGPGVKVLHPGADPSNPGNYVREDGNNFVLDCVEDETKGNQVKEIPVHFWIANIDTPSSDSQYGGHWEVKIYDSGQHYIGGTGNTASNPMDFNNSFSVDNGLNVRMELIWHPNPPPPPQPPSEACTNTTVTDDKSGATGHHSYTRVWISGTNNDQSNYHIGYGNFHRFGYRALSQTITIHVERFHNGNSNPYDQYTRRIDCYHATCNPSQIGAGARIDVQGDGPGGIVQAGHPFTVYVPIKNDNLSADAEIIPDTDIGGAYRLSLTESPDNYQGGLVEHDVPGGYLNRGASTVVPIGFTANGNTGYVRNLTLNFYPDLWPHGSVSNPNNSGNSNGSCSVTFPIYQHFQATLGGSGVSLTPTSEDPSSANYNTTVNVSPSSPPVYIPTNGLFYKLPAGGGQTNLVPYSGGIYPPATALSGNYAIPPGSVNAGDQYCVTLSAGYTSGYVGPGGPHDIVQASDGGTFGPVCDKVINRPYAHIFGNDVSAGGGFGLSCQKTSKGVIYTYNETPSGASNGANKGGTGAQFGAHAMDIIAGLGSANLRGSTPTGLSGLSFANTEHIGGSAPSQTTGGYLGDAGLSNFCVPDYFNDKPSTLTSDTSTTAAAGSGAAQQWHKPAGGTMILNGGTIANGVNQTIFVEGNVNITGDIKYDTAARGSVKDIPSFYLVVKNGNIHIDPSVRQLDGVYVAQPDTTNNTTINRTGIINTCWLANDTNNIYNNCKNQLVVNGAFVANRVLLARSYSSLRYSQSGENNMSGSARGCGNVGKDVPASQTVALDCAAEIFNFSPELYMSQPALNARFGPSSGKYDAITSLSPVL